MLNTIIHIILYLAYAAPFAALVVGIVFYKRLQDNVKILVWFIFSMAIIQAIIIITSQLEIANSLIITYSHLFRYLFLGYIFIYWSPESLKSKFILIYGLGIALNIFLIFYDPSFIRSISAGTLFVISLIFLIYLAFVKIQFISSDGRFWIIFGSFLYFIISFTLFLLSNQILANFDMETARVIFSLHLVMNVIYYSFYIKGILCFREK